MPSSFHFTQPIGAVSASRNPVHGAKGRADKHLKEPEEVSAVLNKLITAVTRAIRKTSVE